MSSAPKPTPVHEVKKNLKRKSSEISKVPSTHSGDHLHEELNGFQSIDKERLNNLYRKGSRSTYHPGSKRVYPRQSFPKSEDVNRGRGRARTQPIASIRVESANELPRKRYGSEVMKVYGPEIMKKYLGSL